MNIGECMEYAQKLCDAQSSAERIEARKELRAAIAATVKSETAHLTRELAEAKARAGSANASLPEGWVAVKEMATPKFAPFMYEDERDYGEAKGYAEGWNACRKAMLSARPEFPPNGLPKESGRAV